MDWSGTFAKKPRVSMGRDALRTACGGLPEEAKESRSTRHDTIIPPPHNNRRPHGCRGRWSVLVRSLSEYRISVTFRPYSAGTPHGLGRHGGHLVGIRVPNHEADESEPSVASRWVSGPYGGGSGRSAPDLSPF